jgi:hypothetical protein|nr:MAG TPA: Protein of unknown function (DUF1351) [Caudoviricetes sp.]
MENNPLALIVKEKTLGSLVTNANDIKKYVSEKLKEYSVDNYTGGAKQAATDKAEINNAIKTLNDRRIALEKEWNMPFQEFKGIITETIDMMKSASSKLDVIVKNEENKEKEEKRYKILELWEAKKFNLITLDRIFNTRWLNKTYKLATIDVELDDIISRINGDLASLDAFGEDTAVLKDLYLSTLNLQATLNKGAELKANRERLLAMEAQKKSEEEAKKAAAAEKQKEVQEPEVETSEDAQTVVAVDFDTHEVKSISVPSEKPVEAPTEKTYRFNIYGSEPIINSVRDIAAEMGLAIVPSMTLEGTVEQITHFKELLAHRNIGYDKTGIINLAVKQID